MNPHPPESSSRSEILTQSSAGVLGLIDLSLPPFCGSIFSRETLEKGRWFLRNGFVRLVTANVQGGFAGIFGQVSDREGGAKAEVSIVIHRGEDQWRIDGRSDRSQARNNEHVAALLMAAMVEKGAVRDLSFGLGMNRCGICLLSADVRAGILHWDDSEARTVLENMPLARVEGAGPEIETRLRAMGLKRLVELYPWDEIVPEFRQCYAYSAIRRGMQEVFWADFLANRKVELEELGCVVATDPGFGLKVVEP